MKIELVLPAVLLFFTMNDTITVKDSEVTQKQTRMRIVDQIIFNHRGASVAPQYHRSYTIKITASQADVKITDYYNTLLQKTFIINKSQWDTLTRIAQDLRERGVKFSQGATGTEREMIVLKLKENDYQFEWDSLQTLEKPTQKFVDEIRKTIPKLQQWLDDTRKQ